jgi:glycopeptide antibiotics resistance protein
MAVSLLALYIVVVLLMTMSPTPLDRGYESSIAKLLDILHRNGLPEWFGYAELESGANIVMFGPLGLLVGLALPERIAWSGLLLLPAFSAAIEFVQATLLSQRFATPGDIVANSVGGCLGLLIAFTIRALVHTRDQRVIEQAKWDEQHNGSRE